MKLSRSVSCLIRSIVWPVCLARMAFSRSRIVEDLARVDLDVRRLTLEAAERLMDHHPRMRQAETLALGARREQHRAHAGRLADADRADVRLDELHGVVDRQARGDRAARRVDVEAMSLSGFSDSRNSSCATITFAM
jgi:hypothetical protein